MKTSVCHVCESPSAPGYALCACCTSRLKAAVLYCYEARSPLADVTARKASATPREAAPHARAAFAPLPLDDRAFAALRTIEDTAFASALALGARPSTPTAALLYVRGEYIRLAHMSGEDGDASYWLGLWTAARRQAAAVLDPPTERAVIGGVCEACGGALVSDGGSHALTCRRCGRRSTPTRVRAHAAEAMTAPQGKATPAEASRIFARAGVRLPSATVRSWIHRGKLEPDADGRVELPAVYALVADTARS